MTPEHPAVVELAHLAGSAELAGVHHTLCANHAALAGRRPITLEQLQREAAAPARAA